jgi:hypothetical protein
MFKDYARCVYFESEGRPGRAFRIAAGLLKARIKHGIGPMNYSLFRFSSLPGSQWGNYITDKQCFVQIFKNNVSQNTQLLVDNKALFYRHCIEHDLPTIPIICGLGNLPTHSDGLIVRINDVDQLISVLESAPTELFIKPVGGAHGDGAFAVQRTGRYFVFGQNTTDGSPQAFYHYLRDQLKQEAGFLVQPRIRAHRKLADISSTNGLATARVVTAFAENKAQVLFAAAKLSVGKNITDNFSRGSTGNLGVGIDTTTGKLSEAWGVASNDWPIMQSFDFHPDTGQRIHGSDFPLWREVLDLALKAQNSLPELKTTGWDIAVTDEGVLLVEANCFWGIALMEVALQRGLRREVSKYYE